MKKQRRSFIRIALFLLLIFAAVGPVTERTPGAPGVFLHQAAVPGGGNDFYRSTSTIGLWNRIKDGGDRAFRLWGPAS